MLEHIDEGRKSKIKMDVCCLSICDFCCCFPELEWSQHPFAPSEKAIAKICGFKSIHIQWLRSASQTGSQILSTVHAHSMRNFGTRAHNKAQQGFQKAPSWLFSWGWSQPPPPTKLPSSGKRSVGFQNACYSCYKSIS